MSLSDLHEILVDDIRFSISEFNIRNGYDVINTGVAVCADALILTIFMAEQG